MENTEIKIEVADQSVTARTRSANRSSGPWMIIVALVLLLTVGAGIFFAVWGASGSPDGFEEAALAKEGPEPTKLSLEPQPSESSSQIPSDDGESLWASPTNGQPIDCNYLLPGTQLVLHVRVAALLAHDEGDKVLAALGPWGQQITRQLTETTGVALSRIDTLLLGIRQSRSGSLDYCIRLNLTQALETENLGRDCFLPPSGAGKQLVWCTPTAMKELKAQAGEPPLFPRELARVVERTDSQRIATLVFSGKFLQISGEKFLRGTGEDLQTAIVDFLGDEATASALSTHWDENFFLELRSTVVLNERPHRFAELLQKRVAATSEQVEDSILSRPLHPYGRKVLARFPSMLRKLANYTRWGEEDKLSLLRCYLPVNAGHNLLMASELLLNSQSMHTSVAEKSVASHSTDQAPRTISAHLQQTTSLVFPKETLQKALEMLSQDLNVTIQILGSDLQLEGITKNQSLELELRDRPASEILLAVLTRANPDRTASGPSDAKQKLVYVVRESTEGKPGAIVVTTRSAALRRGEKLPEVFQPATR